MTWAVTISQILLLAGTFLGLYRMVIGPKMLNRILAFDYVCACIVGLIAVHSIKRQTVDYLEMILIFSLLGFATVISFMEVHFSRAREVKHD